MGRKEIKGKQDNNVIVRFQFDKVMEELKSAVTKNKIDLCDYDEIVWLLKFVLKSNQIFESTKDVETFLGNICGFVHNTKSTGRDRIVDWYFRELDKIEDDNERRNKIKKIAKYSFASIPKDFKGWKSKLCLIVCIQIK